MDWDRFISHKVGLVFCMKKRHFKEDFSDMFVGCFFFLRYYWPIKAYEVILENNGIGKKICLFFYFDI